jgi:DNA-binding Lrp family transcriptional regulator
LSGGACIKKYSDELILDNVSYNVYRSAAAIAELVGCDRKTVHRAMPRLTESGFVKILDIEIGGGKTMKAWIRT